MISSYGWYLQLQLAHDSDPDRQVSSEKYRLLSQLVISGVKFTRCSIPYSTHPPTNQQAPNTGLPNPCAVLDPKDPEVPEGMEPPFNLPWMAPWWSPCPPRTAWTMDLSSPGGIPGFNHEGDAVLSPWTMGYGFAIQEPVPRMGSRTPPAIGKKWFMSQRCRLCKHFLNEPWLKTRLKLISQYRMTTNKGWATAKMMVSWVLVAMVPGWQIQNQTKLSCCGVVISTQLLLIVPQQYIAMRELQELMKLTLLRNWSFRQHHKATGGDGKPQKMFQRSKKCVASLAPEYSRWVLS